VLFVRTEGVEMNEVLNFVNEKTKVLLIFRENQLKINGKSICPLNQQEIASLVPCGKLKVNQIIKELIEEGYVEMIHAKGRYLVTNKGYELLEKMSLSKS
jgi:predicted transcriptional regulator